MEADPPPPPPPSLSPSWLQPEALERRLRTLLARRGEALAWLSEAYGDMAEEVARVVEGAPAAAGGAPAAAPFFEPWVVAAPTPGAGRLGALPLPDGAAFAAAAAAAEAEADARPGGAILVSGGDLPFGFGTFFHEYRVGGDLVAVSVVDVLPTRVASVYFFYNPDLRGALQLGKLSALVEVWLCQRLAAFSAAHPALTTLLPRGVAPPLGAHLDLNFYVHSCRQMRYKAGFQPSEVLCPVAYAAGARAWVPLSAATRARLDEAPAGPLADGAACEEAAARAAAEEEGGALAAELPMDALMCRLRGGGLYRFRELSDASREVCAGGFTRWLRATGRAIAARMLHDPNALHYLVRWGEGTKAPPTPPSSTMHCTSIPTHAGHLDCAGKEARGGGRGGGRRCRCRRSRCRRSRCRRSRCRRSRCRRLHG
jgi:hypothetical protein